MGRKSILKRQRQLPKGLWGGYDTYALALYKDDGATLDDLREAVTTFEETERTARRVFGSAHPLTEGIEGDLRRSSRAILTAATRK